MKFEDMDSADLRIELADWTNRALIYSREYLAAAASGDVDWEHNMRVALVDALDRVRRLERLLRLGVAA